GQQSFKPARMPAGLHSDTHLLARGRQTTVKLLRLVAMRQPLFLKLSRVLIDQSDLLKLGVKIYSYNDHCSAPFSRACWLVSAPPTLLVRGSRHCHGINCARNRGVSVRAMLRQRRLLIAHRSPERAMLGINNE